MCHLDWLTQLLQTASLRAQLELCCTYAAPWRAPFPSARSNEICYQVILKGRATIDDPLTGVRSELAGGDIVLLPYGARQVLHDGSGQPPRQVLTRQAEAGWTFSENGGHPESVSLLCGRICVGPAHGGLIRRFLPGCLVIHTPACLCEAQAPCVSARLRALLALMSTEADGDRPGGRAMLAALGAALFAWALRAASESGQASAGALALAANPAIAPAINAMFAEPARQWRLADLAALSALSPAAFAREFQRKSGHSPIALLTDIRVSMAANALTASTSTIADVAGSVGYRSVSAFRRVFAARTGMTPGQWRHATGMRLPVDPFRQRIEHG